MSRITRYQESMKHFIYYKSGIGELNKKYQEIIKNVINNSNYVMSILLLTILNNQCKKNKINLHGYYIASAIELLISVVRILENYNMYNQLYDSQIILCTVISTIGIVNKLFINNLELVSEIYKTDKDHLIKIILNLTSNLMSTQINMCTSASDIAFSNEKIEDMKYTFNNICCVELLKKNKQVNKIYLNKYIEETYGKICQLTILSAWVLGGGSYNMNENLNRIGYHFSTIIKLSYDYKNLETDILYHNIKKKDDEEIYYSLNLIANYGIQEIFEQFINSKQTIIESCMILDIYTNTCKEIINLIEKQIDNLIELST
jgi:hypothetical protein